MSLFFLFQEFIVCSAVLFCLFFIDNSKLLLRESQPIWKRKGRKITSCTIWQCVCLLSFVQKSIDLVLFFMFMHSFFIWYFWTFWLEQYKTSTDLAQVSKTSFWKRKRKIKINFARWNPGQRRVSIAEKLIGCNRISLLVNNTKWCWGNDSAVGFYFIFHLSRR